MLKFARPDRREQLVVDSGFRCHLTSFSRTTASTPSPFTAKLRKYLRSRRVTSITQLGTDRIIELQFSDAQYRLFLEFYAGGNIVLTDREFNILALLRIVPEGPSQEEQRVGSKYDVEKRQNYHGIPELTKERVRAVLTNVFDKPANGVAPQRKKQNSSGNAIRKALASSMSEYPPILIDHAFYLVNFDSSTSVEEVLKDKNILERLMLALYEAENVTNQTVSSSLSKGYIIAKYEHGKASPDADADSTLASNVTYEDFHPFKPFQFGIGGSQVIEIDGFNKTVDKFFSSIEGQRLESRLAEREQNAKRKLESAKKDYEQRVGGLQQVQELNFRMAQAIEANLQRVQEVIGAVNGLLAQGMDWVEIARLIEIEQANQNIVAETIKLPLKLHENTITLLLSENNSSDDDLVGEVTDSSVSESDDDGDASAMVTQVSKLTHKQLAVDVDLAISAFANASQYYDQKKNAASKEQKTVQSSVKALKNTERKINTDLKKGLKLEKQSLRPVRNPLWFEKFYFFISSEGYLVLGGKDAQQNEILYKRYLHRGDIYVHADLNETTTVVVKNKPGKSGDQIPPSTLSQAGSFAVATSTAWDSKAIMSAWWVHPDQVSKMASTGEYLNHGFFNVQGPKNFLPPAQLLLGLGVFFKVSEESKARHLKHRLESTSSSLVVDDIANNYDAVELGEVEHALDDSPRRKISVKLSSEEEPQDPAAHSESDQMEGFNPASGQSSNADELNPLQSESSYMNSMSGIDTDAKEVETRSRSGDGGILINSENQHRSNDYTSDNTEKGLPNTKPSNGDASSVRHLSARERRSMRKPKALATPLDNNIGTSLEILSTSTPPSKPTDRLSSEHEGVKVRGKHGKRNKLKTRYADQDEEDRTLALHLLGSAATQKPADNAPTNATKEQNLRAQKEMRRQQHVAATERGNMDEDLRRLNLQEGKMAMDREEAESLEDLEGYVGTPLAGDSILDAVVVCGPWNAIGNRCRWRAKLQPGATKKGKAVREILSAWNNTIGNLEKKRRSGPIENNEPMTQEAGLQDKERELLRALVEQEVIGVVPVGKMRVITGSEGAGKRGKGEVAASKGRRGGRGTKKQR